MKYSVDTYRLYQSEKRFAHTVRIHVRMKEPVDIDVLEQAVNTAIRRYPYFAVRVSVDEDGGYVLVPNDKRIVVMPTAEKMPKVGSDAVNNHLILVDCSGNDIFFNISHTMKNITWNHMHRKSENRMTICAQGKHQNPRWIC